VTGHDIFTTIQRLSSIDVLSKSGCDNCGSEMKLATHIASLI